jgi:hypothetical protein
MSTKHDAPTPHDPKTHGLAAKPDDKTLPGDPNEPRPGDMPSINEPPGSTPFPPPTNEATNKDPAEASHGVTNKPDVSHETSSEPLPDLDKMTRAELDDLAKERGVDISHAHNKDEVIAALRKDARRRK